MSLIALLVYIIIGIIVVALLMYAVSLLPDPPITAPFKNLIKLAIILIAILVLVGWLLGWSGPHLVIR